MWVQSLRNLRPLEVQSGRYCNEDTQNRQWPNHRFGTPHSTACVPQQDEEDRSTDAGDHDNPLDN